MIDEKLIEGEERKPKNPWYGDPRLQDFQTGLRSLSVYSPSTKEYEMYQKGKSLSRLGKYKEAIECFDEILKIIPNANFSYDEGITQTPVNTDKGICLSKIGKYKEAIECFDKVFQRYREDPTTLYNKGITLYYLGEYIKAISCYNTILHGYWNKKIEVYNNKGIALYYLGKYKEAIECFDKVLTDKEEIESNRYVLKGEGGPFFRDAWYNRGLCLEKLNKYEEALLCYDRAKGITQQGDYHFYYDHLYKPDVYEIHNNGITLFYLGKYKETIECFDEVLAMNPLYAASWYNRACVKVKKNHRLEDILTDLKKAIEIDKKFLKLAKKDKDFENIRHDKRFQAILRLTTETFQRK